MANIYFCFRSALSLTVCLTLLWATAALATPFDELHCYKIRDTRLADAAIEFVAARGDIPENCELTSERKILRRCDFVEHLCTQ